MAAMIASRRSAKLLEKLLCSGRGVAAPASPVAACTSRSFNTSAEARDVEPSEERSLDVERRGGRVVSRRRDGEPFSGFFSDVLDPIFPGRSLSEVLNLMDQLVESPMAMASRGMGMLGGPRRGWNVKEDENALYLRIDMPGLGKEQVKVAVEQNTLVIRGEGEKESAEEEAGPRYSSRIDLPPKLYNLDQIRAEMKNGVLKVLVPKVKEEERKDVVQIQVA
ncbi:hypothetical protein Taro_013948 [Colocasia esculenta]|uniref:SHSP domain-containing protein n=1 Tax=Colocasia esculenta TaxID=4460 RepID=A0A843UD60_COLES|nr:hypothetical protein [Colocasia esculenta]